MQLPKKDSQLPEWIDNSTHLMALVFDQEGRVVQYNQCCGDFFRLSKHSTSQRVLVFSPSSRELRLDIIAHLSPENCQELNFWMECESTCLSLGRGWEVSPLSTRSEERFIALKVCDPKELAPDSDESMQQLHFLAQKMKGFLFEYELNPEGDKNFSVISFGAGSLFEHQIEDAKNNLSELLNWVHPEDREKLSDSFLVSAESLAPWELTFRFYPPSKSLHWAQGLASPKRKGDGGLLWHGFIYDVTERVEFESKLITQQKELEEIAFLQAHEFRRPVANLLGLFDLIEMQLKEEKPCFEQFESLLGLMKISVKEADAVIAKIVQRTHFSSESDLSRKL